MSTTISRTFNSVPARTAVETWRAIVDLVAPGAGEARSELQSVEGVACSLITDKAMTAPIIVMGEGPRVRIYCAYDDSAIEGDSANENSLATIPTEGDWSVSLPCDDSDLAWVTTALEKKSKRISARSRSLGIRLSEAEIDNSVTRAAVLFDEEAFLRK